MIDDIHKGSGCLKCPVNEFDCDAQYRGSRCAALRAKEGVDFDPKTNADRIRAMSDEKLADHNVYTVEVWNQYEGYHETAYRCSDGYTTDDYEVALAHELDWLQQPAEEDRNA